MDQKPNPSPSLYPPGVPSRLEITAEDIEFAIVILTNLLEKYEFHSDDDIKDVVLYLIRKISDIQFQLML